jgi:hypothetical protein
MPISHLKVEFRQHFCTDSLWEILNDALEEWLLSPHHDTITGFSCFNLLSCFTVSICEITHTQSPFFRLGTSLPHVVMDVQKRMRRAFDLSSGLLPPL